MAKYELDSERIDFRKVTTSVWGAVKTFLACLLASLSFTVLCYLVFSLVFSTPEERRLKRENRMYGRLYPRMREQERLLGDVVENLDLRDNSIYRDIFSTNAPVVDLAGNVDLEFDSDPVEERHIVLNTDNKISAVAEAGAGVEKNLLGFIESAKTSPMPPMGLPVSNFSYARVGATVGMRLNPFYKVMSNHTGLDIMAAQGESVLSAGEGTVVSVKRSRKGEGNTVEIDHGNGYVTRYAHLGDIVVRSGQKVKTGTKIAAVGMTGNTFAPHLHYEVLKDGHYMDPVNYLFASLSPEAYTNVVYIASSTRQSMD